MTQTEVQLQVVRRKPSALINNANAIAYLPSRYAIVEPQSCLSMATLTAIVKNTRVSALINTGSSCNYVNEDTAKILTMHI